MNPGLPVPQPALYSDHSLVAFLGAIVQGRRVGIVGPASGDVAKRARALGASTVVAFGGTGEGVAIRPLSKGAIEAFQGRLDVLVVLDAASVPLTQVLDEARKTLGQDGVIVVGSRPAGSAAPLEPTRAGEGPDYGTLEQELGDRFDHVTMVGRGPFVGYLYARIDAQDADVTLDTRLLPDDAASAEAFIAVAGDRRIDLDSLALVQIPPADVLGRAAPAPVVDTRALEEEVAKRDAKIKELEKSAAERWVQVQKLENELKTSDDDARKARDRAVRLAKDLDDEQKRRQRSEIEGAMQRRASEMPAPSAEELRTARERLAQAERDLEAARTETTAATKRLADLGRELDESQAAEGELRRQLDLAESRKKAAPVEDTSADYTRVENELRARAEQVNKLEAQVRERDAAVRELAFSLESLQTRDVAGELQSAKERIAELSSLNTGLASEANSLLEQNDVLRERIAQLESELSAKSTEVVAPSREVAPSQPIEDQSDRLAMAELRVREQTEAVRAAEDRAIAAERRADESLAAVQRAAKQHDEERARATDLLRQLTETRNELSTQYAMVVSMEERVNQVSLELEGTRAGYVRRVRELEREVEGLLQALEVVGTHSSDEDEKVDTLMRDIELMRAERTGIELRLRDAEASLTAQRQRVAPAPRVSEAPPAHASNFTGELGEEMRNEQLLADLAETAARLASTEESLVATREAAIVAEQRAEEMRTALEQARAEVRAAGTAGTIRPGDDDESERREAAERELLVRSLVAQLEDRDLRLRALERRLVEEVERARRTESEIWEVELRARDQRIQSITREMERARSEGHAGGTNGDTDLVTLRNALEGRERELLALKTSIETVRTGLSNILVDGRGAVIAHDLVTILRQIEEPGQG